MVAGRCPLADIRQGYGTDAAMNVVKCTLGTFGVTNDTFTTQARPCTACPTNARTLDQQSGYTAAFLWTGPTDCSALH